MAVVRRDILSPQGAASRDAYVRGVKLLKQEIRQAGQPSTYDLFVLWHHRTMMIMTPPGNPLQRNAAHAGPVFLPWHRYKMIVLEQQLQRVLGDPNFGLPYWNWGKDGEKPRNQQNSSAIWAANCMGGGGNPVNTGPFAFNSADPQSWRVRYEGTSTGGTRSTNRGLRRSFSYQPGLPRNADLKTVVNMHPYDLMEWDTAANSFRNCIEGWAPTPPAFHNCVHVWIGGDMGASTSPNDPVFYLNHANVDRAWAAWQQKHGANAAYVPDAAAPAMLKGHRLNDRLTSIFPNPPKVSDMLDV